MNKAITQKIKSYAYSLGFDACSICKEESVDEKNRMALEYWLACDYHSRMEYMERNKEKRLDPTLLVENAKSIIMLALNYYPQQFQSEQNPQFSYYAYGQDYHDVIKKKLKSLLEYIKGLNNDIEGRAFCDTAPLLERYWAAKTGLGWIGKNSMLIIPKKGSFYFLAALILNKELEYDDLSKVKMPDCGNCTKCIDACPTKAITAPRIIDSHKCISYQTIENKEDIDSFVASKIDNRVYGCDICQQVCPWNRFATAHLTEELSPSKEFLSLTLEKLENLDTESYQRIFKGSAVKRAKLSGLKRNVDVLKKNGK